MAPDEMAFKIWKAFFSVIVHLTKALCQADSMNPGVALHSAAQLRWTYFGDCVQQDMVIMTFLPLYDAN